MPDDVLKACAEKGGVIGIEAAPHTTLTKNHPEHSIESVMEHFEYVANLVGIDNVAFGLDTLYEDHFGLHKVILFTLSIYVLQDGNQIYEYHTITVLDNTS